MSATASSTREEIRSYQEELQRAGRYLGKLDGIWGPKTQRAHEAYVASLGDVVIDNSAAALESVRDLIIATAERFLNLTETSPNSRWDFLGSPGLETRASDLREMLLLTGWQPGWAYCVAFVEVCWRAGYRNRPELALISRSITPSAMGTFENFERLHRITKEPLPGAIMLMQHGDSWLGHAGIVIARDRGTDGFTTIEGNTSPEANSREGDGVYRKHKRLDFTKKSGLWLRGFVNPFLI